MHALIYVCQSILVEERVEFAITLFPTTRLSATDAFPCFHLFSLVLNCFQPIVIVQCLVDQVKPPNMLIKYQDSVSA